MMFVFPDEGQGARSALEPSAVLHANNEMLFWGENQRCSRIARRTLRS